MRKNFIQLFILALTMLAATACANAAVDSSTTTEDMSEAMPEPENFAVSDESTSQKADDKYDNITVPTQYSVGDILLSSGLMVKLDEMTALDNYDIPVAVVAGMKDDGKFFAVGVHRSGELLQWESDDATVSSEFDFINSYADNHGLTGVMASDWYMPSIVELCTLYENRDVVNESLEKIYRSDNNAAMNGLSTTWYWSSTQSESQADYAWFVHFHNGYAGECPKNFTNVNAIAVCEL